MKRIKNLKPFILLGILLNQAQASNFNNITCRFYSPTIKTFKGQIYLSGPRTLSIQKNSDAPFEIKDLTDNLVRDDLQSSYGPLWKWDNEEKTEGRVYIIKKFPYWEVVNQIYRHSPVGVLHPEMSVFDYKQQRPQIVSTMKFEGKFCKTIQEWKRGTKTKAGILNQIEKSILYLR